MAVPRVTWDVYKLESQVPPLRAAESERGFGVGSSEWCGQVVTGGKSRM